MLRSVLSPFIAIDNDLQTVDVFFADLGLLRAAEKNELGHGATGKEQACFFAQVSSHPSFKLT